MSSFLLRGWSGAGSMEHAQTCCVGIIQRYAMSVVPLVISTGIPGADRISRHAGTYREPTARTSLHSI